MDVLTPSDDEYLRAEEVVKRLKLEFAFVVVSQRRAAREIDQAIAYLRRLQSKGLNPFGGSIEDRIAERESERDVALHLTIADSPEADAPRLSTVISASEPIMFGYASLAMEARCRPLVERCAKVLGYKVETE